jgi:hypothetical protein
LKGNKYLQLVKKYVKKDEQTVQHSTTDIPTTSLTTPEPKKAKTPTQKRKVQISSSEQKKKQKNLEAVAQELEITELQQHLEVEKESYLPASRLFKESMDILISAEPSTSIQNHDVCVDCTILQEEVAQNNQQIHNLQKELNASKTKIKYLQITTQNTQQQLDNIRYYVQMLWNKHQTPESNQQVSAPIDNQESSTTEPQVIAKPTSQSTPEIVNNQPYERAATSLTQVSAACPFTYCST